VKEVIRVTPAALEVVRKVLADESKPEDLALWLEVNGSANGAYTYDLWFGSKSQIRPGDVRQLEGDIPIVVPEQSVERVRGAVLDVNQLAGEVGLVIINAKTPPLSSAPVPPRGDLTGPVARRVLEVLEQDVNPQIAMHGGRAALVAVEGPVAYVQMSGGCQGCGMARATLSQGIAVAITDAVPEISEVVDVTDHMSGTNPYFEPGRT
jgi:Fe/S biogenesis protein NfuA